MKINCFILQLFKSQIMFQNFIISICCFLSFNITAQSTTPKSTTNIYNDIKKLNFLGSVLYVAAHPDDENNSMLAYLENEVHARTAYLSLTRGDGGQNIIGTELRELLGVIRTEEMLAARRIDGAEQYFSRANDFGFSKNPYEALTIWGKEKIMEDVVWVIRNFRPDIIINRFDHRNPGTTHGHHTAASRLSLEAFNLAADETAFPNHLDIVDTHKTQYFFFNTAESFYKDKSEFETAKENFYTIDAGTYYPTLGQSNTEISAASRSEHQCQGMGTTPTRGTKIEYLELLKGEPKNKTDIFSGINTTWSRIEGGSQIGDILQQVEAGFNFTNPSESVEKLIEAFELIQELPNENYWKTTKLKEIENIIISCAGLFLDATTVESSACPGDSLAINIEAINRSAVNINLTKITFSNEMNLSRDKLLQHQLKFNQAFVEAYQFYISENAQLSNAYWLKEEATLGSYKVDNQMLIGLPETPHPLRVQFHLNIMGTSIVIEKPVTQKYTDTVVGEVIHPFEIVPPVMVNLSSKVFLFSNDEAQQINVKVRSEQESLKGILKLKIAEGWNINPKQIEVDIDKKGATQNYTFELTPPNKQSTAELSASIEINGKKHDRSYNKIEYSHIPRQIVLLPAKAKIVRVNLKTNGKNIAYIMGAGDVVPQHIAQIGYTVTLLEDAQITTENLKQFDAVMIGIRAFNVRNSLQFKNNALMNYVKQGGNVIVQYNTNHKLITENIGPYPIQFSRDRVTDENAEVTILQTDHPLMNYPNKITEADFENWVQERGLYFPNKWDSNYIALLSCNDPNEPARNGGLLYAEYGDGQFIYTGYSWFRQLPAGVPGAYRLLANMLANKE